MDQDNRPAGGFLTFLPYGLTVLGAAIGMFYVRYGTDTGNPMIGLIIGAAAGRGVAALVARYAERRDGGI